MITSPFTRKFVHPRRAGGFTLIELIIALAGGLLLFLGLFTMFSLGRSALTKGGDLSEINQNGRIALERMSRELRQADEITEPFSQSFSSPSNEIQFRDGHDPSNLFYIRYYLTDQTLHREVAYYSLTSAPTVHVYRQDINADGSPASKTVTEDESIAEYITSFALWRSNSHIINVSLGLGRTGTTTTLTTSLYDRNLQ